MKFHLVDHYHWYFTINFYNIETQKVFEFERVFEMVHLRRLIDNAQLIAYHAFHDKFEKRKFIFNLDEESFIQIK